MVYLQEVPEPRLRGRSNGDLLAWAINLRAAVRQSNADKTALREWAESQSHAQDK